MENIEDLLKCDCGSVFFDEIRAKTYIENQYIFHASTPSAKLSCEDTAIPVAKCLFCGKVYLPRTSFAGRNTLDRSVQLYAELTRQWTDSNIKKIPDASLEAIINKDVKDIVFSSIQPSEISEPIKEAQDVEAKSDSGTDIKNVVPKGRQRSKPIKDNEK